MNKIEEIIKKIDGTIYHRFQKLKSNMILFNSIFTSE